jgi:hypothetical protein
VSSSLQSSGSGGDTRAGAQHVPADVEVVETHDALSVLADGPAVSAVRPLAGVPSSTSSAVLYPAVQAAAAAAGGFLAGAALIRLVNRRHRRAARLVRRPRAVGPARASRGARGRAARSGELVQIVGSRSLLVDVHLLAER